MGRPHRKFNNNVHACIYRLSLPEDIMRNLTGGKIVQGQGKCEEIRRKNYDQESKEKEHRVYTDFV
jgi:hypothetical protein